jgi:hypothetical protein
MQCAHCLKSFHAVFQKIELHWGGTVLEEDVRRFQVVYTKCPACARAIIFLDSGIGEFDRKRSMVWPKGIARAPLPAEVPEEFAADYREACLVLTDSAKACAALSRRCLQHLLREKVRVKPSDLSKEIDELLASKALPSDLADAIDAIRNLGNFAAHPLKSSNTGLILDVEPGEAEWLLDVLEDLFDFYFVRPAKLAAKRAALDKKLAEANKPAMKEGT